MAYIPYPNYYQPMYQQNVNNDRLAYLQQYQQQMPQPQPQTPAFNQGLLWVQGEAGAKSYMVAPGASVLLMDSESQKFYIKTVDGSGVPTMRTFEYKEVVQNQMPPIVAEVKEPAYATHEDIEELKKQIDELKEKMEVHHEPVIQSIKRKPKPNDDAGTNADGD